jgi:glycerophosphoryl diester phosphodiesterase
MAEIKRLDAGSWFDPKFSAERILTFDEAVALVGTRAGLYPELKTPALYRARGVDQTALFVAAVTRLGLHTRPRGTLIVQSFDPQPLRDSTIAMPTLPRTFLIDTRDGARWFTPEGMKEIARFAHDVGPSKLILDGHAERVAMAHQTGLTVTPYTVSTRNPSRFADVTAEMRYYLFELGVDAVFTDNPDRFPRRN